ncbi:hypothetical protein [Methylobacterium sp. A54F]
MRQALRGRDLRIRTSGCAQAAPEAPAASPTLPARGLTARELIRMAQAARRTGEGREG